MAAAKQLLLRAGLVGSLLTIFGIDHAHSANVNCPVQGPSLAFADKDIHWHYSLTGALTEVSILEYADSKVVLLMCKRGNSTVASDWHSCKFLPGQKLRTEQLAGLWVVTKCELASHRTNDTECVVACD